MRGFTVRQKRFIDFFDGNATQAARAAGYKHPRRMGSENLSKPDILAAITARETEKNAERILTRQQRQEFWSQVTRDENIELKDRLRASELLGKSQCDFSEKRVLHQEGEQTLTININKRELTSPDDLKRS